jgi:hypothetical protein
VCRLSILVAALLLQLPLGVVLVLVLVLEVVPLRSLLSLFFTTLLRTPVGFLPFLMVGVV